MSLSINQMSNQWFLSLLSFIDSLLYCDAIMKRASLSRRFAGSLWKQLYELHIRMMLCRPRWWTNQLAFWIKLFSLPQHLVSQAHWPVMWWAEQAWTQLTVQLFVTPWTAAQQFPLPSTISHNLLEFMSIELVMLTSHLLPTPSPFAFNFSQHQGLFQWVGSLHQVAKVLELQHQHKAIFL